MESPPALLAAVLVEIKAFGLVERAHASHGVVAIFVGGAALVRRMPISHVVPEMDLVFGQKLLGKCLSAIAAAEEREKESQPWQRQWCGRGHRPSARRRSLPSGPESQSSHGTAWSATD